MPAIQLSRRVRRVQPSPTLAVSARARELKAAGQDVIGLAAGEPDFDTPQHIKDAAVAAIAAGQTKYTAVDGTPELKQAVADKFRRENGLDYGPDQILVSCGGKHSFYNLAQALLEPGDEVVIPAPYWVSYPDMVRLAGGEPVFVPAGMDQGFKLKPEQLEAALTPRTRLVVINSPSNPTGAAYSRGELEALGEVLRRRPDLLVASDDMYEHILWSGEPFCNIVNACPDLYEQAVVLNGVSKAYAMTGWRIGYAAGPRELIRAMKTIQSQSTSNPCSVSQAAARAALAGDQDCIRPMVAAFRDRHDRLVARLNRIRGVRCLPSQGTFYSFPDFSEAQQAVGAGDDVALAAHILEKAQVALVPGSAFGAPGHQRLSFATSQAQLDRALDRLESLFGTR